LDSIGIKVRTATKSHISTAAQSAPFPPDNLFYVDGPSKNTAAHISPDITGGAGLFENNILNEWTGAARRAAHHLVSAIARL
jgi:hypothetical protein